MHVITGELRDDPYIKEGDGWTMYSVKLSEYMKIKGEGKYTNYRASFFAKTDQEKSMYSDALKKGNIVSITSDKLLISQSDQYINLEMQYPRLEFFQRSAQGGIPF